MGDAALPVGGLIVASEVGGDVNLFWAAWAKNLFFGILLERGVPACR
jgi:hypothetical protein